MAGALRILVLGVVLATVAASTPQLASPALAAALDRKGKADAKEAMRFYKEGNYEDAARLFLRLSINYPDMLVFVRNLGACYYYMRRYEPALSNLRDYLHRKTDIAADDRAEVSGWIGEMERLRDQSAPPPVAPAPVAPAEPTPPAAPPVPAPVPVPSPSLPAVPGVSGSESSEPAAPSATPAVPTPTPPAVSVAPVAPAPPAAVPPASPPSAAPSPAAPVPPAPAVAAPSPPPPPAQPPYATAPAYGSGPYGAQPGYGQGPYAGQPAPYGQQGYPPAYGQPGAAPYGYGPAYPGYGPGGAAGVGVQAQPPQGASTGRKVAAWMLGIVGVGGLAGGGYLTYLAKQRFDDVEAKYDPDKESQGKRYVVGAGICYGAGGALLLTAIIVGATGGSSGPVAVAPVVGPSMAGASLGGSF